MRDVYKRQAHDSGEFTVDFLEQPPGHPATGFPPKLKADASDADKAAFNEAEAKWNASLKTLLQKLSPANLKNYDGVIFASTTGDLPVPDPQGFLDWIKAGHAFIGICLLYTSRPEKSRCELLSC